ncbi:DinB family protein [Robertmurraya sp. FSL W8-0741]|uniref:DinB family protein n=1 Tax=Robertmurraya TaxID=2837507 RepID=UPI0010F78211|nr:DinB family protein [Robertmurraya siralis]
MQIFFNYNWMVRKEWYQLCEQLSEEDLLKPRVGGMGSILRTFFHIIDVEWSWIRMLEGKPDIQENFDDYKSLKEIRALDERYHSEVSAFVRDWDASKENQILHLTLEDGKDVSHTWGEVVRHIIAHEIHHIGQLSIWVREMGIKPVSANVIERGLSTYSNKN